jgi:hypothetical protein
VIDRDQHTSLLRTESITAVKSFITDPGAKTWAQFYNTFYGRNLRIFVISQSAFQPSLIFASKVRPNRYLTGVSSYVTCKYYIRLEIHVRKNSLAYYEH